jgi:lipopolysaccharide/colanic/teichoic acid biosynthesis glycosyltransferase
MIHDTDNHNPNAWSVANDPRITKIGKILRDTWLDETLQFFNVLKGDMNIIGPRPELPYFVELFSRHLPNYNLRHTVRPGLTGLSQVLGFSGDTCILLRFKKDIEYIQKKSEKLDRRILLFTLKKLLSGIRLSPIRCSDCQFKDDARSRWICFDVRPLMPTKALPMNRHCKKTLPEYSA